MLSMIPFPSHEISRPNQAGQPPQNMRMVHFNNPRPELRRSFV